MSKIFYKNIFFIIFISSQIIFVSSYPYFPTILTVSIPIFENNSNLKSRVENNYVRWLQASGSDIISVHPWTSHEDIDKLLSKVNGVLLQGNPNNLDINSDYYKVVKYIYEKIIKINDSGIRMPLIALGDDLSLLCSIISEDNTSINTELKYPIHEPTKIKLFSSPERTIILKELEKEDMKVLEKEYVLPNNLKRIISVKNFLSNFHLGQKFNMVATSKTKEGKEYISIIEGKKYPIIMVSFHPEYVVFETNDDFIIPETLNSIYISRFIGNGFIFYARQNVKNDFTVEEKEKYGYIDPYGPAPQLYNGRYNYIYEK